MPSKVLALWLHLCRPKQDYGVDTMKITDDDAAFILGKGGRTKEKISKVSGLGLRESSRNGWSSQSLIHFQIKMTIRSVQCCIHRVA